MLTRLTPARVTDQSARVGVCQRTATMDDFDHILNWKLKAGSHLFPGKDGGTCINEAAVVATGFEYQRVSRVEEMPECFSRPICKLAMGLNDYAATDAERQRLLPYVMRLACADTPEVEAKRAAFIKSQNPTAWPFDRGLNVTAYPRLEGARMRISNGTSGRHARD